jgi:hypothetical protein
MDYLHAYHCLQRVKGEVGLIVQLSNRYDKYGDAFDPRCMMHLERIIRATGAKLVISSTWRNAGFDVMVEMWNHRNYYGEIIGITPTDEKRFRGNEVKTWIEKYGADRYVILDDDSDFLPEQQNNFIRTDSIFGLSYGDAEKAIKILNQPLEDK